MGSENDCVFDERNMKKKKTWASCEFNKEKFAYLMSLIKSNNQLDHRMSEQIVLGSVSSTLYIRRRECDLFSSFSQQC